MTKQKRKCNDKMDIREMTKSVKVAVREKKSDSNRVGLYLTADIDKQEDVANDILAFQHECKKSGLTPSVEVYKLVKLWLGDNSEEATTEE